MPSSEESRKHESEGSVLGFVEVCDEMVGSIILEVTLLVFIGRSCLGAPW